ncbi:MAG: TonB-dependent receptor [Hyphomonas sp.]
MSSKRSFSRTFLCGVAFGALTLSGAAWAQDATTETTEDEAVEVVTEKPAEDEARQEKITVTGSLLRRDEFTSASPIQVITADTASLQGLVDSASILQGSSLASGSTQINNQFAGYVVDGGTGVNTVDLRGCGTTRTLVLINGKRPGPSGTRGAVGAFDFNVLPGSIVQRYDVLKDSGSTIYGSDAVCGVVNVVTRTQVEKPELNLNITKPFDTGGESYELSGAYGFNFDMGSIALAASYTKNEDLSVGDRSYLDCTADLAKDPQTGEYLDRVNRSITADGELGCSNIYHNTVLDRAFIGGPRLVPSTDGVTVADPFTGGSIAGYRPRRNARYGNSVFGPNGPAFYEDVLTNPKQRSADAINARELTSVYGVGDFDLNIFGGTKSITEVLFTNRKTTAEGWRQFFPTIGSAMSLDVAEAFLAQYYGPTIGALYAPYYTDYFAYANDPSYTNPLGTLALPITIWPSNTEIDADYLYIAQSFSGDIGSTGWGWSLGGNYSKSDASYTRNQILASTSGDLNVGNGSAPTYDPFDPDFLSGNYSKDVYNLLTGIDTGNTEYEQWLVNGSVSGDLFSLPAGKVAAAVGFEYRDFSINDVPGEYTQSGDIWGSSTAGITKGSDNVAEIFAEVEIPLLKGVPFAEELTVNVSGRAFDYDSFGSDSVYKVGANWQITPSIRLRATQGTSFRAPALFEQYLDAQTAFLGQTAIDPCIDWGQSNNQNIQANCAAVGIPDDYAGAGSSALIVSGGNGDSLKAETSDSFTIGTVFTPTFADINIAVDYYEFEVSDQIGQLGAGNILTACYGGEPANFATNTYCDLFTRDLANGPGQFAIEQVNDYYLNINKQLQRGIDLDFRYEHEFKFGDLIIDGGGTWTLESLFQNFDPGTVVGFDNQDFNGTIGEPSFVGDARIQLDRGDWTYTWATDYIGRTSDARYADDNGVEEPYFGTVANFDYTAEATIYHHASVRWTGDTWQFTVGIRNIFDDAPPTVSNNGVTALRGQVPLVGTQYDLRGRRAFFQVSKTF